MMKIMSNRMTMMTATTSDAATDSHVDIVFPRHAVDRHLDIY